MRHGVLMGQQGDLHGGDLHGEIRPSCSGQVGHEPNGLVHNELGHGEEEHDEVVHGEVVRGEGEHGGVGHGEVVRGGLVHELLRQRLEHEQEVRDVGLQQWHH